MITESAMGDALSRYLDLSTRQMRMTAGNMANVDTPGYRTQGFNFEQQFSQALSESTGKPIDAMSGNVDGLISRPDGNNVSLDREAMEMAKAQLQFRTGVQLLKSEFSSILDAIKSS